MCNLMARRGYTLIELVLVMFLLGVLSLSAIDSFPDVGAAKTDGAARKLVSDLSYARHLARNRNGIYGITFNEAADTYTVFLLDPNTNAKTPVTDPLTLASMIIDFTKTPGLKGIDLQSPNFGGTNEIRFTPQGIPQNGAGVNLATTGTVLVVNAGSTHTVAVQPATGEVNKL